MHDHPFCDPRRPREYNGSMKGAREALCLAESLTTARMTLGWIAGASACSSCSEGYFAGEAGGHLSMLIDGGRTRIFRFYRPAAFAALP